MGEFTFLCRDYPSCCDIFSASLFFNYKGKQLIGALWLIITSILVSIIIFASIFGMGPAFQYILFPLFLTPSILITEKNKHMRFSLMTIIMTIYLGLEFFNTKAYTL